MHTDGECTHFGTHAQHSQYVGFSHFWSELLVEDFNRRVPDIIFGSNPSEVGDSKRAACLIEHDHACIYKFPGGKCDELTALTAQLRIISWSVTWNAYTGGET